MKPLLISAVGGDPLGAMLLKQCEETAMVGTCLKQQQTKQNVYQFISILEMISNVMTFELKQIWRYWQSEDSKLDGLDRRPLVEKYIWKIKTRYTSWLSCYHCYKHTRKYKHKAL